MKTNGRQKTLILAGALLCAAAGIAIAHEIGEPGQPVCLEGNFMVADAQNTPFASAAGPGRVLEMNIFTGQRGITVDNPFTPANVGTPIVPDDVAAPGPFKPTGVLSGGKNGHAFITGAAQHTLTEFHRDGTPIRSVRHVTAPDPALGFGAVPRLLGSQFMPNGNIIQAVCDANFFNAPNTDPEVFDFFPPVSSTPARAQNSRLLVIDPATLEVIDEYNAADDPRWTCMAGIIFSDEGMYVSMFHGAAVFVIDWEAGLGNEKKPGHFKVNHLGAPHNQAQVVRVIDMLGPGAAMDDPRRRDSLRAISLDESGALYATFRDRATQPSAGSPADFRQHVAVVPAGEDYPSRTIAMDHGVQIIAGLRTNRMSGPGCAAINPGFTDPEACNVETLLVASSAFNPGGCDGVAGGCFAPGGGVGEYLIDPDAADGPDCRSLNTGCAQPITTFEFIDHDSGLEEKIDPRMLMIIHEAFVQ